MSTEADWSPRLARAAGPHYLAIADAIEEDMRSGRLSVGTRLPPQRSLAAQLGIDFTTVSRGYAEAARRGLVEGRVGQGTYVRAAAPPPRAPVDLSMNLPPHFDDPALTARLWDEVATLREGGLDLLLRYQDPAGALRDRAAGAAWLAARLPKLDPETLVVTPGAQGGLLAVMAGLAQPGDAVCAEALTFPGFRALAAQAGLRLVPVLMDAQGMDPDAFARACREHAPKALYCTPTLHNPTTATLPLERRQAIVEIARRHGVTIVEDDAYAGLAPSAPPPMTALAPETAYHVAGLAKSVSPALRIAYVASPSVRAAGRVRAAVRASAAMASPLTAAIATRWIETGAAAAVTAALRAEAKARHAIALRRLPSELVQSAPDAFHLWLTLPEGWTRGEFVGRLGAAGVGVVPSDAFSLGAAPEAVRIGLGGPASRADVERALGLVAALLEAAPQVTASVV
ncbi:PLP-dependent aminotransferase family protein [Phenylobacterium sp.]|uniref:aminotransferase-like domain-containing protein n=1 Tax=Phenylobacterium sp. TaxID=1871053 RepID=UPI002735EFC2|nr:PLP-dependent aminotransferase family protein [Phenylobacterium sp.]MDP3658625.1 PLP-dependent aminotransferase family protein [Phenylobacterium sp.]